MTASSVCAAVSAWIPRALFFLSSPPPTCRSSRRARPGGLSCFLPVCAPRPLSGGRGECFSLPDPVIWSGQPRFPKHGALPVIAGTRTALRHFSRAGTSTRRGCCFASKIPGKVCKSKVWGGQELCGKNLPVCLALRARVPGSRALPPTPSLELGPQGQLGTCAGIRLGF